MFIALEGVDGSGKTTLADAIAAYAVERKYAPTILHFGPPETNDALAEMVERDGISQYTPGGDVALIADRLHFGGPVYAPVYRPERCLDDTYGDLGKDGWRYAELFFESRGLLTVMVTSPAARERMTERGDDYALPAHHEELRARYDAVAVESVTLGMTVEMREMTQLPDVAQAIVHAAQSKERWAAPLAEHRGYIGVRLPETVVVMNPDRQGRRDVLSALGDSDWMGVGIASALESHDSLERLIEGLRYPHVIGYGNLPGHVENVVARHKGEFVGELTALADLVHLSADVI